MHEFTFYLSLLITKLSTLKCNLVCHFRISHKKLISLQRRISFASSNDTLFKVYCLLIRKYANICQEVSRGWPPGDLQPPAHQAGQEGRPQHPHLRGRCDEGRDEEPGP